MLSHDPHGNAGRRLGGMEPSRSLPPGEPAVTHLRDNCARRKVGAIRDRRRYRGSLNLPRLGVGAGQPDTSLDEDLNMFSMSESESELTPHTVPNSSPLGRAIGMPAQAAHFTPMSAAAATAARRPVSDPH